VQELLKQLQTALQDQAQLGQMYPDARMKDHEMFTHLNLNFDLANAKVTVETAAKDVHGMPHYQYIYDTAFKTGVEVSHIDDTTFNGAVPTPYQVTPTPTPS